MVNNIPMLAAIYARYSSENQDVSSIQDQYIKGLEKVNSEGLSLYNKYSDEAVSGSTPPHLRPGCSQLISDALSGGFQYLIVEGLDRLSRDSLHTEQLIRKLEFAGVIILGISDGYDSRTKTKKLTRGMRGIINEIYLDDLKDKTHRGLSGKVDRGLFAGGISYGYKSIEVDGGFKLEVNQDQAKWVEWIYKKFITGMGCRKIAVELNKLNVPSPRGSSWSVSAIYGNQKKGTGILNNELYIGRYIWNRSTWKKDPETGKRKRIERPENEWKISENPELRIVTVDLWQAVKDKQKTRRAQGGTFGKSAPPKTLLGGLMTCSECGSPFIAINSHSYGCSHHKDRGTCSNNKTVNRKFAESQILNSITDDLLSDGVIKEIQKEARIALKEQQESASVNQVKTRIKELDKEIANITEAIAVVGVSLALTERLKKAEQEKSQLRIPAPSPDLIPRIAERYQAMIQDLPNILKSDINEARSALSELLGDVQVYYDGKGLVAEIGGLESILLAASPRMVAGAGFCSYRQIIKLYNKSNRP